MMMLFDLMVEGRFDDLFDLWAIMIIFMNGCWFKLDDVSM